MADEYREEAVKLLEIINSDYEDSDIGIIADALRDAETRGFEKAKGACIAAVERMPTPKITLS